MTSMRKAIVAKTLSVICMASIVEAGRFFLWNLTIWKMIIIRARIHRMRKMMPEMNANVLVPGLFLC
jgi:hypothetical protein